MDTLQLHATDLHDTICAVATPPGEGGIAVIRLAGTRAIEAADAIWHGKRLADTPARMARFGTIINEDGTPVDEAVALIFRAPHSYSGDDTVELSIHGSTWLQTEILRLLCRQPGVRLAQAGEFTRRAFINGRIDLTRAEAVADLIAARTRAQARLAVGQMRGSISSRIKELRQTLIDLTALIELELDFAEENVEFASRTKLQTTLTDIINRINSLHSSYRTGNAIRNGVPVSIIGPVNAGKSSLLNALVGESRAIVSNVPGTTRDIVEDTVNIGLWSIRLMDTAGLRSSNDPVETIGIERAKEAMQTAFLRIYVVNAEAPVAPPSNLPAPTIIVWNKADLHPTPTLPGAIAVSAITHHGLDTLTKTIAHTLNNMLGNPADTDCAISNVRQAEALAEALAEARQAIDAITSGMPTDIVAQHLRHVIQPLSAITGAITTPEILKTIFSRFCIGK